MLFDLQQPAFNFKFGICRVVGQLWSDVFIENSRMVESQSRRTHTGASVPIFNLHHKHP